MVLKRGLLLFELLVVLFVLVTLTCLAAPIFATALMARKSEISYQLIQDIIAYARSEALRQSTIVYLCPAKYNRNGVLVSCNRNVADWSQGVLAFIDYSGKGVNYSSGGRVKAVKFSPNLSINLYPSQILQINPDSTLAPGASANLLWTFSIVQKKYSVAYKSIVTLNTYGVTNYQKIEDVE